MSTKRKKRSGVGAATGALIGGSAGAAIGVKKKELMDIRNSVRQRNQKAARTQTDLIRRTNLEGRRQVEFMNTFFRPKGDPGWQYNPDPKILKRKAKLEGIAGKSLKNTKGVIAKYTIPPAVVGGVVGHFLEKKAEGDINMSKANEVMEKLAAGGWLKVLTGIANRTKLLAGRGGQPMAKAMNNKTIGQLDNMAAIQAGRANKAQEALSKGQGSTGQLANQAAKLDDANQSLKAIGDSKNVVEDLARGARDEWSAADKLDDLVKNYKENAVVKDQIAKATIVRKPKVTGGLK